MGESESCSDGLGHDSILKKPESLPLQADSLPSEPPGKSLLGGIEIN